MYVSTQCGGIWVNGVMISTSGSHPSSQAKDTESTSFGMKLAYKDG